MSRAEITEILMGAPADTYMIRPVAEPWTHHKRRTQLYYRQPCETALASLLFSAAEQTSAMRAAGMLAWRGVSLEAVRSRPPPKPMDEQLADLKAGKDKPYTRNFYGSVLPTPADGHAPEALHAHCVHEAFRSGCIDLAYITFAAACLVHPRREIVRLLAGDNVWISLYKYSVVKPMLSLRELDPVRDVSVPGYPRKLRALMPALGAPADWWPPFAAEAAIAGVDLEDLIFVDGNIGIAIDAHGQAYEGDLVYFFAGGHKALSNIAAVSRGALLDAALEKMSALGKALPPVPLREALALVTKSSWCRRDSILKRHVVVEGSEETARDGCIIDVLFRHYNLEEIRTAADEVLPYICRINYREEHYNMPNVRRLQSRLTA